MSLKRLIHFIFLTVSACTLLGSGAANAQVVPRSFSGTTHGPSAGVKANTSYPGYNPLAGRPRVDIYGNYYLNTGAVNYRIINGQVVVRTAGGIQNAVSGRFVSNFDKRPKYSGINRVNRLVGQPPRGRPYNAHGSPTKSFEEVRRQRQAAARRSLQGLPAQYQRHPTRGY